MLARENAETFVSPVISARGTTGSGFGVSTGIFLVAVALTLSFLLTSLFALLLLFSSEFGL